MQNKFDKKRMLRRPLFMWKTVSETKCFNAVKWDYGIKRKENASNRMMTEKIPVLRRQETGKQIEIQGKEKSARRDSNPRPRPWQGRTPPLSHSRVLQQQHDDITPVIPLCQHQKTTFFVSGQKQAQRNDTGSQRFQKIPVVHPGKRVYNSKDMSKR